MGSTGARSGWFNWKLYRWQYSFVGGPRHYISAGVAGVACAGIGAWLGQRLGGSHATAGLGAAIGAVSGSFAPSASSWVRTRAAVHARAAGAAELWHDVSRPSRLLDPVRGVVEFTGRADEIVRLVAWCEDDSASPVRLITGPGGVGKTRLALRLSELMRELGWRCVRVGDGREARAIADMRAAWSGRLLLIVDYAETRTGLAEMLHAVAADDGPTLRVLLLARSMGPWWEQLGAAELAIRDLLTAAAEHSDTLGPVLDADLGDEDLVRVAAASFVRELGVEPPGQVVIAPHAGQARVLDLHAAALVAVLNSPGVATVPVELSGVLDELLRHEERFWLGTAQTQGLMDGPGGLTRAVLSQIVAMSCLLGAADEDEALALLDRIPEVPRSLKVAEWLRGLYPPEPGSGDWIGMLQPDRLAGLLVVNQLGSSPTLARRCLTGLNQNQARRAAILLAQASSDHDAAGPLLEQLLPLAADAIEGIEAPREILITIDNAIPYTSVRLAAAHAAITQRILDTLPTDSRPVERAWWLNKLGLALAQAGHADKALPPALEAVRLCRELLAMSMTSTFDQSPLANTLANLAMRYLDLDRPAEALPLAGEAVTIYRELAEANQDEYRPLLAAALANTAICLPNLGRPADALPPTEEAVAIRRELAEEKPDRYLPDLAVSLNNLGTLLAELGRTSQALQPSIEAVKVRRQLAASSPDLYGRYLARSLTNLAARFSELGRAAEAVPPAQEAVPIYRELAAMNPIRYSSDLADSLTTLARSLAEIGRGDEAVPLMREAADIFRELSATSPGRYGPDLAQCLVNLAATLSGAGNSGQALPISLEAVTTYRKLAARIPDRYRPDLARALGNLGGILSELGRSADALPPAQEAVTIRQQLSELSPEHYASDLAFSLANLGAVLWALGRRAGALAAGQQSVAIYRELAETDPVRHGADFARSLKNLGIWLAGLGRASDAISIAEEAVTIYRELATANPSRYRPTLAASLSNLCIWYAGLDAPAEALPVAEEWVATYRELAAANPERHRADLARALANLAAILSKLDRASDAEQIRRDAAGLEDSS